MRLITKKSDCKKYRGTETSVVASCGPDHAMKYYVFVAPQRVKKASFGEGIFRMAGDESALKN